jgi:hypothetical protein
MREQLNNNPAVQMAVVVLLLLAGAFFFISTMGGGGSEESGGEKVVTPAVAAEGAEALPVEGSVAAAEGGSVSVVPPATAKPPATVTAAYKSGETVVLLFVRDGGIDDRLVRKTTEALSGLAGVASFVVPAAEISRYSTITGGIGVERVPALVVVSPKKVTGGVPTGSVSYGFQSRQAVVQAVIDAGYEGPTLAYHP